MCSAMLRRLLLSGLLAPGAWVTGPASAQVTYPVAFAPSANVLTVDERALLASHFQEAGRRWARKLVIMGPRSIEIELAIDNGIASGNGRSATSVFVGVFGGRDTFEQGAAAELRTGTDPNGASADVLVNFNLGYLRNELWFDPDPASRTVPVPADRTDAMSVALHELGHALAYNGFASGNGTPPAGFWSTFDRWMVPGTPALFDGPRVVATWGAAPELTTNNINHWGNPVVPARAAPPLAAPVEWRAGAPVPGIACGGPVSIDAPASMSKQDRAAQGGALIDELMNGLVFVRGARYSISPLDVAALSDVGLPANFVDLFADGFESVAQ